MILVCRTCLNVVKNHEFNTFDTEIAMTNNVLIRNMLENCVPEMDLDVGENSGICITCLDMLKTTYLFKTNCHQTEQKLYTYLDSKNLPLGVKVNLVDVMMFNESSIEKSQSKSEDQPENNILSEDEYEKPVIVEKTLKPKTRNRKKENPNYKKRVFTCDRCEYKTYRAELLENHQDNECSSNDSGTFKCEQCSYTTIRKRNLIRHKLTHGGVRPYQCEICLKGFTERYNLKAHMYKHSGKKLPFSCSDCDKAFARKCDLNTHIRIHARKRLEVVDSESS